MFDPCAPHVRATLESGQHALSALYAVAGGSVLPDTAAATHRAWMKDVVEWLALEKPDDTAVERGLALIEDVDQHIRYLQR